MNDYEIDDLLKKFYSDNKINMTTDSKNRIKKIYKRNIQTTPIKKRILIYQFSLILCAIILIPASAFAASYISKTVYEKIYEKVKNANLSEEQINDIVNDFTNDSEAVNGIEYLDELKINENGLTYGPDELGADLIAVISDQGELGYVYRDELYKDNVCSIDDALLYEEGIIILNVYASDGITIIGTFTYD